jgi:hypothetical protein
MRGECVFDIILINKANIHVAKESNHLAVIVCFRAALAQDWQANECNPLAVGLRETLDTECVQKENHVENHLIRKRSVSQHGSEILGKILCVM